MCVCVDSSRRRFNLDFVLWINGVRGNGNLRVRQRGSLSSGL